MVVGWHLGHWASQLGHLYFPLVISLKATEHHLPLTWLKTWDTDTHTLDHLLTVNSVVCGDCNHFTHRPPGRESTSRCQSWRKVPVPCWQSRYRRETWWPDRTGSPLKRQEKTRWDSAEHRKKLNTGYRWLRCYLRQVVLPALASVGHEIRQPLFALFHFLLAKGLAKKIKKDTKRK